MNTVSFARVSRRDFLLPCTDTPAVAQFSPSSVLSFSFLPVFYSLTMSQSSGKQVMSGLRTVKRDFSSNNATSDGQASKSNEQTRQDRALASAKRLKMIQDALNGESSTSEKKHPFSGRPATGGGESSSSASLKRTAGGDTAPPAKKRQLPSSWDDYHSNSRSIASYSSTRALSSSTSANGISKTTISVTSTTTKSTAGPASVFLSEEQKHILKLVERGESLFYTGSAGESLYRIAPGKADACLCRIC